MKTLPLNSRKIELLIYVLIWGLVFSVPYFSQRSSGLINWSKAVENWIHLTGYLVIFLVNVYLLVPGFLLKKRYPLYFGLVSVLIVLVAMVSMILQEAQPQMGPHGMKLPLGDLPRDPSLQEGFRPGMHAPGHKSLLTLFVDKLIISILVIGAGTTTKLMTKWLSEEKLRKDAEKEHLKTNLALLRHQVSPHFLMNTLNNIHSLVEIDAEKAQEAIDRLSTLMRYLLYDSAQSTIQLKKEIEFIRSFISLMQLRHSEEVEVKVVLPEQIPDIQIPPMLFISLLENAFKHGVSYPLNSYIHFKLELNDSFLVCVIKNSKHKIPSRHRGEYSGIGLDNIKKSLKLIYDDEFKLDIHDNEHEFEVNLKIPI